MRVLAYDPYLKFDEVKKEIELVDLRELVVESDFVTLHTVLSEETRSLISTSELNLMKPTAYLINASRGSVVDEKSIIDALKKKKLAEAGLDVFSRACILC